MTPLEQRLSEIEARVNAATEGPWRAELTPNGPCGQICYADAVLIPIREPTGDPGKFVRIEGSAIWCDKRAVGDREWRGNLVFIAHVRSDVPYLLKLTRSLQAEVELMRVALGTLKVAVNDKVNDPGATAFIERTLAKADAIRAEREGL